MAFEFDWVSILLIFFLLCFISTYLFRRFFHAKTFIVASMIKTKRFLPLMDKFAKHKKIINFVGEVGLVLGFGAIAADYLYGRKYKGIKRIGFFFLSAFLLFVFFYIILGASMLENPLVKESAYIFGVVFAFTGFAGFTIASLIFQAGDIFIKMAVGKRACPGVAPIIPGVNIPNVPISIPIHAWISLLIILIVHEGFHGITARKEKVKVKSSGVLLFGFLPIGAFVEPDEIKLKKLESRKALRLYAAGPSANLFSIIVFSIISILLFSFLTMPLIDNPMQELHSQAVLGVKIAEVDKNVSFCGDTYKAPAYGVLKKGWKIKKVNEEKVTDLESFAEALSKEKKTISLEVLDDKNELRKISLTPNPLNKYGFSVAEDTNKSFTAPFSYTFYQDFIKGPNSFLSSFFFWLSMLSLLIAIVNFLPIEPFDGGKIAKIIFSSYLGFWSVSQQRKEKVIEKAFLFFVLILLILNALPLFF